uniref:Uncharacterized protein n=1 Tax=Arundo donax TaxID=35708 RepID=A0A0A9A201_ARUDO
MREARPGARPPGRAASASRRRLRATRDRAGVRPNARQTNYRNRKPRQTNFPSRIRLHEQTPYILGGVPVCSEPGGLKTVLTLKRRQVHACPSRFFSPGKVHCTHAVVDHG